VRRVERSGRLDAPPGVVFAYLADLGNLAEWQSGVVSAERTSDGEVGVGTTGHLVRDMMGQRLEAPLTVTEFEPPSRLAIASEVSGVRARIELSLAAVDGVTDLAFAMEIRGSMLTAFMEPMIANAAAGDIDESLRRLRERFAETPA
jgi:uncharacterized protein YndB with AHSA1/START domain